MKVIRQICYEGTEEALRKQLAKSLAEGKRDSWWEGAVSIEVRTIYSELPVLEPFVPVEEDNPYLENPYLLKGADAKAFIKALKGEI
jgi:hypothetical protein